MTLMEAHVVPRHSFDKSMTNSMTFFISGAILLSLRLTNSSSSAFKRIETTAFVQEDIKPVKLLRLYRNGVFIL